MFEKEAEEYTKKNFCGCCPLTWKNQCKNFVNCGYHDSWQEGAEFGYNKANEWHDVRHAQTEEDFPPENKDKLYAWKVDCRKYEKEKSDIKYHIGTQNDLMYEVYAYRVIAWKEIVLPEIKESE